MHKIRYGFCLALALVLFTVGVAFAAVTGKLVTDPNNNPIQASSPYPPASACTTTTVTKGAITTVTVAGYSQLCFESYTGAGRTPHQGQAPPGEQYRLHAGHRRLHRPQ
nr:hypothetical protein [uncultured bacterium]